VILVAPFAQAVRAEFAHRRSSAAMTTLTDHVDQKLAELSSDSGT
jgi:histone H3/H4